MKARYERAKRIANQIRVKYSINDPHVDMSEICTQLGWKIKWDYSVDGDGMCEAVTIKYKGKYCIFLPKLRRYRCRVKWSLCHEAAHIFLGHFEEFNLSPIHAFEPDDDLIKALDREADAFTAELLMSSNYIEQNYYRGFDYLRKVFGVSREAMRNRLDNLGLLGLVEAAATTETQQEKAPEGAFGVC